jgi:hypothetical protein
MGLSRRINLRVDPELLDELRAFGAARGLAATPAARLLLAEGLLRDQVAGRDERPSERTALAALLAAEHAVLMVASILPEGERRMRALAERASAAAAERLATVTDSAESE